MKDHAAILFPDMVQAGEQKKEEEPTPESWFNAGELNKEGEQAVSKITDKMVRDEFPGDDGRSLLMYGNSDHGQTYEPFRSKDLGEFAETATMYPAMFKEAKLGIEGEDAKVDARHDPLPERIAYRGEWIDYRDYSPDGQAKYQELLKIAEEHSVTRGQFAKAALAYRLGEPIEEIADYLKIPLAKLAQLV